MSEPTRQHPPSLDFPERMEEMKQLIEREKLYERPTGEVIKAVNAHFDAQDKWRINEYSIRIARHAARKAHGLPRDGVPNYPRQRAKPLRFLAATKAAEELLEAMGKPVMYLTGLELQKELREKGHIIGPGHARQLIRKAQKRWLKGGTRSYTAVAGADPKGALISRRALATGRNGVPSIRRPKDLQAAVELLAEQMRVEDVITVTVSLGEGGSAGYTAERRKVETITGSVKA